MGTGYTRNDTANNIADGNVINASDLTANLTLSSLHLMARLDTRTMARQERVQRLTLAAWQTMQ